MRLLLDEQLSRVLAEELRRRGHDVVAIVETDLREARDDAILAWATAQGRAVVTNNIRDFRLLHTAHLTSSRSHCGIVLLPSAARSLHARALGGLVAALDSLLQEHPHADALRDREVFL
ncbi:MAG: DUF5615 family PIN-like protein [Candidatus Dormibacteria bacterium]